MTGGDRSFAAVIAYALITLRLAPRFSTATEIAIN
jgi:hypothetical protein